MTYRGMPGLEEVALFHDISVWCDSVRVPTGPHVSLIRVTQPEGCRWIPELARGVVATQTLAEGESRRERANGNTDTAYWETTISV